MKTLPRLGLFAAGLAAAFGAAAAVGAAVGPIDVGGDDGHTTVMSTAPPHEAHEDH